MRKYWLTAAIPLAAITVAAAIGPVAASGATTTLSAKTTMINRDDSSAQGGNWAKDNFTRGAQIFFKGAASLSSCGGNSPCYHYTGKVSDVGHFTTVSGQLSPGFGYLNGAPDPTMAVALTGTLSGSQTYDFYTTVPISGASAGNVPPSEIGNIHGSGEWPELFFPAGTEFWISGGVDEGSLGTGGQELGTGFFSYTYTAKPGADSACPNVTSQWKDASPSSGSSPADGNILAPDSSGC
jgi:hypothetical protein